MLTIVRADNSKSLQVLTKRRSLAYPPIMELGRLNSTKVADALTTTRIKRSITVLSEVDSTNRHVLDMPDDALDGVVVVAERQTQGRGRRGNQWQCPAGAGLLCTVGLADLNSTIDANLLSLVVPIALSEGIFNETGLRTEIKWPNDLVFRGRKLSGILIEAQTSGANNIRYAVGFGINCLQHRGHFDESIRDQATSLDLESDSPINREAVLASVLNALDARLLQSGRWSADRICGEWRSLAAGLGGRCEVQENGRAFSGNLIDIDPNAAIIVQLDEGGRRLFNAASTTVLSLTM
ncbi:MAG: biotin--[acetyl-CoA-carboxylase] ligase [Phycisphaerae bacterium]|nr:MAG: biotin--[acetyl-CoA-carboxylase] ligase [Phycisphaerae bacterium]